MPKKSLVGESDNAISPKWFSAILHLSQWLCGWYSNMKLSEIYFIAIPSFFLSLTTTTTRAKFYLIKNRLFQSCTTCHKIFSTLIYIIWHLCTFLVSVFSTQKLNYKLQTALTHKVFEAQLKLWLTALRLGLSIQSKRLLININFSDHSSW